MKLLIVDDNPINLRLLRVQLEAERHAVFTAANGVEALEALEREPFDGVISDVLMPEMDGFRLCHEIRSREPLKAVPVVLYTATYMASADRELALAIGADAFITKPAPATELIAALRAALAIGDRQRRSDPMPADADILGRYSAALVRKLEEKNVELGDAHDQLRDLFDNSHDLIQAIAPDGHFLYANRAWHELLGYGAAELAALRIFDIIDAGSRSAFRRLIERLRRGAPVRDFELQLNAKDGRKLPVEGSATPRIVDGKLVFFRCTWRDVTERKAAEAARQFLASIVDSSADAIVGRNLDGIVTSWNAGAERIFGYTAFEMIGNSIGRLIPDDRKDEERQILSRMRRGERVDHFDTIRLRRDGRPIDVALTISPVVNVSGAMIGVSKIARDVTLHRAAEASRRASEEHLAGIVNSSMDAIVTIDARQNIFQLNPAAERMFGWASEDAIGAPLSRLLPARFRAAHEHHIAAFRRTGFTSRQMGSLGELTGLRRDGTEFPVEVSISQMEMADGHYFTAILRDVTERRNHEIRIARMLRIRAVLSGINAAIVRIREPQALFDEACRIAYEDGGFGIAWIGTYDRDSGEVTPVAWRGLEGEAALVKASARVDLAEGQGVVGRAIREGKPAYTNDALADNMDGGPRRAFAVARGLQSFIALPFVVDDQVTGVLTLCAQGTNFFNDDEIKLLVELAGDISFALSYNATDRRAKYLAYYDALTGLPNRTLFIDRVAQALKAAVRHDTRVAVIIGDIDGFRRVNEVFGRHGGDTLLRDVAAHARSLSPAPENSARVGADQFAALVTDFRSPAEIAHVVEASLAAISETAFDIGGQALNIAMRAGIAVSPEDGNDPETLLGNAETALTDAKRAGARYLFYQASMTTRITETMELENKLRRALELEQFELHYQPVIDARSGNVVGLEGLLRWNDPDKGLTAPGGFVAILEATGMIVDVGEWVIRRALMQAGEWRRQGIEPPRIAVNVSPRQLLHAGFIDGVTRLLAEHGDAPPRLDFEITEGMVMTNFEETAARLTTLRALGIGIAIDDFGTGYSSLSYLGRLPVSALKVDRSFVSKMTTAGDSMTIVSTIISLAHSMNLTVIAEGVETEEQAKFLKLLRCDQLQGYLYSRPLPADQARAFLIVNSRGA